MAGGQKIDDHGSWIGASGKDPLPMGSKSKYLTGVEGAGSIMDYEDTEASIKAQQVKGISQAKSKPMKPNYRQ